MTLDHRAQWDDHTSFDDDRYRDLDDLTLTVEPDERVGAPLPKRNRLRRTLAGLLLMTGAGTVAWYVGPAGLIEAGKTLVEGAVSTAQDIAARSRVESSPDVAAASNPAGDASPLAPAAPGNGPEILPVLTPVPEPTTPPAAEAPATEALGTDYAETAAPAETAQDQTPKRKRAIAVGLGPDLPNVLLSRLSKADLENAGYAIKTALAKTQDDASFAWPKKPSRQQALFEIRFVEGAAPGCRRYVVTVTKERWSSTSAALEKCGSVRAGAG
jgi:hypothetical protein